MPIHDLGYRAWEGKAESVVWRSWVIAETGVQLAWKSHWLRRILLVAWLPAAYLGLTLFLYERSLTQPETRLMSAQLLDLLPGSNELTAGAGQVNQDESSHRRAVWALILLTLFRYPQGVLMVLLVGMIAPPLIARDMRSRAYLLYFSRPLERADYVIGKSIVVWIYLALITTLPAMALYLLGVCLSPDLSVVWDTWDLPLRVCGASIWLIVPTTALALCFSSLTTETRYAAFAWFAIWILGWVAYGNLRLLDVQMAARSGLPTPPDRWTMISLYHSLGTIQSWVFGLEVEPMRVLPPIVLILGITMVSLLVLFRRISAPLQV